MKSLSNKDKKLFIFLGLSVLVIILGIMFLLNAMQDLEDPNNIAFFHAFCSLPILAKYIIVILIMAVGIMTFSNISARYENRGLRNGLTIGITTFSFVLTLPLVYVFIAIMPLFATAKTYGIPTVDNLGAVDKIMRTDNILRGFIDWFGDGAFLWVVFVFMLLLSIVFLLEPLVAGICVTKGKVLNIVGKNKDGKTRLFVIDDLPVLKESKDQEND